MTIIATSQSSEYGTLVRMIEFDATDVGGALMRFTPGPISGSPVLFGGQVYAPYPFKLSGLEWGANGGMPKPKLKVSNIEGQFVVAMLGTDDLVGAKVRLIKTFSRFLDGEPDADPNQKFPDELFYVNQLVRWDDEVLEWQLAAVLDQRGIKLPRSQILKDFCSHKYRRWLNNDFDYSDATCPYVDLSFFNDQNENTALSREDKCAKNLTACRLRFGEHSELPFDGFPGVARVREDV